MNSEKPPLETIIKKRIEQLRNSIANNKFDTVLILSDENRRYLSGYSGEDGSYDETAGILVITQNDLILVTDSRYDGQAGDEAGLYTIHCYKESLAKELAAILKSVNAKTVGFEAARITFDLFTKISNTLSDNEPDIQLSSADELLKNLRIKKDAFEIKAIKTVLNIAETAFMIFMEDIHEGMTEKEAAWIFEKIMREEGADSLSFPVIAASGKNSALPHAIPGERQFKPGESLLFDFGARLNGYCSDTTRTVVLGKPDPKFDEVYDIVFQAQKMAVEAIKPGKKASEIDKIARDHIDATAYQGSFGHSLGHGVGIAIHEAPRLSKLDDTILEPGMVITVEPGIYLPDWGGIRLENMILVTERGAEVLNQLTYGDYSI